MTIKPNSYEERKLLGLWIKKGQGLIVSGSPLGESYLDPSLKRVEDVEKRSQEFVKFDHETAEQLPHLKGKFRYALETYFRDLYGPYLPKE